MGRAEEQISDLEDFTEVFSETTACDKNRWTLYVEGKNHERKIRKFEQSCNRNWRRREWRGGD